MAGYIKIDRRILEWEWYKNINTKILFLHMLLKANWKDTKFEGKTIPKGSFVSSISKLAVENDLTVSETKTAIKHLKNTGEITVKSYAKYSVFTITNYCSYQCDSRKDSNKLSHNNKYSNAEKENRKNRRTGNIDKRNHNKFNNFNQREYDYETLEAKLLGERKKDGED